MNGSRDWGLLRKDNILGGAGVGSVGQETPVHIRTIANIGVVVLCRSGLENPLHKPLGLVGPLQEELDDRGQDLQLGLVIH